MNIIERIESEYGELGQTEKNYLLQNLHYFTDEEKENFMIALAKNRKNKKEKPSVSDYADAIKTLGKKPPVYYWCKCLECGCEYMYGLPMCPDCYDNGFECRAYSVLHSEFRPPIKTIKYNKQYMFGEEGEQICFNCVNKKMSFCEHFGKADWYCKDYRECPCSSCCIKNKKKNEEIAKQTETRKPCYRIPLKVVKNVL